MNKVEMFELGVRAINHATQKDQGGYVCPLCLQIFRSINLLSDEHVPPKKLGGSILTLTCKRCNNSAGSTLNKHQIARKRIADWWDETRSSSGIDVEIRGVRGEAIVIDGVRHIVADVRHNAPVMVQQLVESLGRNIDERDVRLGGKHAYSFSKSRIADLRDAYLWAFAEYGYSLIANQNSGYEVVREAISKPENPPIRNFAVSIPNVRDPHVPKMFFERNGFMIVCHEGRGCVLPAPGCPNPYSMLDQLEGKFQLMSKYLPAPQEMRLRMDLELDRHPKSQD